jgi:hypothetical protein
MRHKFGKTFKSSSLYEVLALTDQEFRFLSINALSSSDYRQGRISSPNLSGIFQGAPKKKFEKKKSLKKKYKGQSDD